MGGISEVISEKVSYIYGLYSTSNPEMIRYIGYSNNPRGRLSKHIYDSKFNSHHKDNWIKQELRNGYSIKSEILRCCKESEISKREIETILLFKSFGTNLLNCNNGGLGGISPREETREKMRASKIGNKWNVGRKPSEYNREMVILSLKGKPKSKEHIDKFIKARRGNRTKARKVSDETIIKTFELFNSGVKYSDILKQLSLSQGMLNSILYNNDTLLDVKNKYNLKRTRKGYRNQFDKRIKK